MAGSGVMTDSGLIADSGLMVDSRVGLVYRTDEVNARQVHTTRQAQKKGRM